MKCRIQFTPAGLIAGLCAAGWFALWLVAFSPQAVRPPLKIFRPPLALLTEGGEQTRMLQNPTRFALPSESGFSGRFLEDRIDLRLALEKPSAPLRFFPVRTPVPALLDRDTLLHGTGLPQSGLLIPGDTPRRQVPPLEKPVFFPSPELAPRTPDNIALDLPETALPESLRVWLRIRSDGTVERVLIEPPADSPALLRAIRQMQFIPAEDATEGWAAIRPVRKEGTP